MIKEEGIPNFRAQYSKDYKILIAAQELYIRQK